jgi:hypothetical protein
LADATCTPADDALGNAVGNAGSDLVAKSAAKSLFDVAIFNATNDGADGQGKTPGQLRVDAFGGKTLIEFVNAASK